MNQFSFYKGQPSDGPMGISVALTPATTVVTVSKSMITNASFRTKKLPGEFPLTLAIIYPKIFVYSPSHVSLSSKNNITVTFASKQFNDFLLPNALKIKKEFD